MTAARLRIKPLSTPWRLRAACSSRLWDFFSCTSTTARSCSRPGSVCVCVCVCVCVLLSVCMYVCMYVYVYTYVCMYVYV